MGSNWRNEFFENFSDEDLQEVRHQYATDSEESCPCQQLKELFFHVTFWGSEQLLQQM